MNNYQILMALVLLCCIGCQNHEKDSNVKFRICDCPMENLPDEQTILDSTFQKSEEDDFFDWSIGGKISGSFKKIIDAEIDGNLKSNEGAYQVSTRRIIEKINNSYPELITKAYSFKVGKVFYCTFYSILCQDTTLSDQELRILSSEKLEEFRKDILTYTKPTPSKEFKKNGVQPKINTEIKGDGNNTIIGDDNQQEIVNVTSHNQQGGITAHQVTINNIPEKRSIKKSINEIITELKKQPIAAYRLHYSSNDPEASDLANDIDSILKNLNWQRTNPVVRLGGPSLPKGVTIFMLKEVEPIVTLTNQLWAALGKKGVEGQIVQDMDNIFKIHGWPPIELPVDRNGVVIFIGPNPED